MESVFLSRFKMNNIAPKLQKCRKHKIAFEVISETLKQPNFFYSQPSTLPKDAPAKFYLSTTFGSSFMVSSAAPTRLSTFYPYLITWIGNRNLKFARLTAGWKTLIALIAADPVCWYPKTRSIQLCRVDETYGDSRAWKEEKNLLAKTTGNWFKVIATGNVLSAEQFPNPFRLRQFFAGCPEKAWTWSQNGGYQFE